MKTLDLIGAELDYWVAKAESLPVRWEFPQYSAPVERGRLFYDFAPEAQIYNYRQFQPSTNWSQGGPLIEKYGIFVKPNKFDANTWLAGVQQETHIDNPRLASGPTPLIAAMRARVAVVYGEDLSE